MHSILNQLFRWFFSVIWFTIFRVFVAKNQSGKEKSDKYKLRPGPEPKNPSIHQEHGSDNSPPYSRNQELSTHAVRNVEKRTTPETDVFFRPNTANRPPPRNRRVTGQSQIQQSDIQINKNESFQAAAQHLNYNRHVLFSEARLTDWRPTEQNFH